MVDPMLQTPLRRSYLSMLLRSVPLRDKEEAEEAIAVAVVKELSVTQRIDLLPSLQYPFLYSFEDCSRHRIHHSIPHRPIVNLVLRGRLRRWRELLRFRLFIPQCSSKTIGDDSRERFQDALYPHLASWDYPRRQYSTSDLEAAYVATGIQTEGACEVRYAWKFNDLKPRVYYAIGSTAHWASRFVWAIFDTLQRVNLCSDPDRRYSFQRFPLIHLPKDAFIIYDYASFTSRLVDFQEFVAQLAGFLHGYKATAFDSRDGIVEIDLGHVLSRYNATCNQRGLFDVRRFADQGADKLLVSHEVAGMLGVYGNITGSTALHGMIGMAISGADDTVNTIGDDAGLLVQDGGDDHDSIKASIRSIGDIADEKFEIFVMDENESEEAEGWHYTKRPITVRDGLVIQGWMPEFPIIARALAVKIDHITIQPEAFDIRRSIFIKQVCRFLSSLTAHYPQLDEVDIELALTILRSAYHELRLPTSGSFPSYYVDKSGHLAYPHRSLCIPQLSERSIKEGWWSVLVETRDETGYIRVPAVELADDLPGELSEGTSFRYRSDPVLSLLEKMHIVRKTPLYEERLLSDETLEILHGVMTSKIRPVYLYECLQSYAPWTSYKMYRRDNGFSE